MSIHRWLNMPNRAAMTRSPGLSVLDSDASQRAGAAGREDVGLPRPGLEDLLQVLEHRGGELGENRTTGGPPSRCASRGGCGRAYWWAPGRRGSCGRPCASLSEEVSVGRGETPPPDLTTLAGAKCPCCPLNFYASIPCIALCAFFHKAEILPPPAPRFPADSPVRELLTELYAIATQAVDPAPAVASRLALLPRAPGRRWILALGKAAGPMARAAVETLASWGSSPRAGWSSPPPRTQRLIPRFGSCRRSPRARARFARRRRSLGPDRGSGGRAGRSLGPALGGRVEPARRPGSRSHAGRATARVRVCCSAPVSTSPP